MEEFVKHIQMDNKKIIINNIYTYNVIYILINNF